ncbi:NADH-quinone oxidoreductase subunit H [Candidatus Uhrbacteria bacterium]|nr:NADH-quinone oxidoreductase subunit H [Candidatus Uhrbacteria bacterium]
MMIIFAIIQAFLVILVAPFLIGWVRLCKARLQGRHGASPLLPYYTFLTLMKKEIVFSTNASWVFRTVPFVVLGTTVFAAAVLPLLTLEGISPLSHFVLISGILALGSVFLVLGGLDSGSAFGGMGASREMTIAALVEPAFFVTLAGFGLGSGTAMVSLMIGNGVVGWVVHPGLALSLAALVLVSLAENARYPVDNPATHLELTMVHEAMILEYSGPYLALLELASWTKLTVFVLLIGSFLLPSTYLLAGVDYTLVGLGMAVGALVVKLIVLGGALALLETSIAKMRFFRMQEYLAYAFVLGVAGLIITLIV